MSLLKDDELLARILPPDPIIRGIPKPADWYSKISPIQPSSIDLHIGNIFLPGTKRDQPGSGMQPLKEHILEPGHTAVVTTVEKLIIPGNIAGIGFPPTSVSSRGILMTNPGHVDPGYEGPMSFTVINMGKQKYILRSDDMIVTLLLFQLSAPASKGRLERHSGKPAEPRIQENLDMLASDFMDFERRATDIAKEEVKRAGLRIKWWGTWAPILAVIITALVTLVTPVVRLAWREPLEKVTTDVAVLKASFDLANMKTRLDEVERLLKKGIEKNSPYGGASEDIESQDMRRKDAGESQGDGQ